MRWASIMSCPHPCTSLHTAGGRPHHSSERGHRGLLLQEDGLWEIIFHEIGQQEAVSLNSIKIRFKYTRKNHGERTYCKMCTWGLPCNQIILIICASTQIKTKCAVFFGHACLFNAPNEMLVRQTNHTNIPCQHAQCSYLVSFTPHAYKHAHIILFYWTTPSKFRHGLAETTVD